MSGAGNDFIIFDAREQEIELSTSQIVKLSDRKHIGCDQLIIIRNSAEADCLMEIFNSDGSLSGACGNATRCVAAILMNLLVDDLPKKDQVTIKTAAGILKCWRDGDLICVDMGIPNFDWQKIPLSKDQDSQKVSILGFDFACVNVGNPHAVTFVDQALSDERFFEIGPKVETNILFPQKTNVEFARILSDELIEVRVWERGAGETLACGTGACAVGILAIKHGLIDGKKVVTRFKGGDLTISWNGDEVVMTGGYELVVDGICEL